MESKLDLTDKKLLFELDMNARATNAEIAKKLNISKQSVQYRINKLIEQNIIAGFYTAIDLSKIGYLYVRFIMKFKDTTKEIEKEITDYALNNKKFGWILSIDGKWDFAIALLPKNYVEIKTSVNDFLAIYGQYVLDYDVSIVTRLEHLQNRFLLSKTTGEEFSISADIVDNKLDALDINILNVLSQNARSSLTEIAKVVKESYKVVSYRISQMEKKEIIKRYRTNLNFKRLGYTHYKVMIKLKNFTKEKMIQLKAYIKQNPNSIYITEAIGLAELEFEIVVNDYEKFHDFLQDMRNDFSTIISDYYTVILYNTYQINYLPKFE